MNALESTIPPHSLLRAGAGFKPEHFEEILQGNHKSSLFEIHAENYMGAGGRPHQVLESLRADYPISCHGVGLSIGSAEGLDPAHLKRLKKICDRYEPVLFSEHLAWSSHNGSFLNDLLPLPYTEETVKLVSGHIDQIQNCLGRQMLLENPSLYLSFHQNSLSEIEFLKEVTSHTGCGLLLDVNNVFVSATNLGFDAQEYIAGFPVDLVQEIHLAGFSKDPETTDNSLLIDAHNREVAEPVWQLYTNLIGRIGSIPTIIEWDSDIPRWNILSAEVQKAEQILRAALPLHEALNVH
ncbi:DUF692 domain-containing protein [Sneathiella marina]|uniref:UPF0276 protein NBZ79_06140 n=1 Tax=Sneathiella marina TaxID=2950108 RepID=A0ABY4W671_9PROT|nr:DUF692 domain-containing protein [Sneathiella marina]USG62553.1 DUF692 domain-containing protein [Sneathiella marina]